MKDLKSRIEIYFLFLILSFSFFIFNFTGCATGPTYVPLAPPAGIPGIYHRVEKGETLWRISRLYNVNLEDLINANHISDATNIEIGQSVFIPHGRLKQEVSSQNFGDDFLWPAKGRVVSTFGQVSQDLVNKGLNIRNQEDQGVAASRSGRVVFYDPDLRGFGKTIIIDHADGFSTVYAGLDESLVKPGDTVQKGAPIARGINLHFEIRKGYVSQNPYFYLPR